MRSDWLAEATLTYMHKLQIESNKSFDWTHSLRFGSNKKKQLSANYLVQYMLPIVSDKSVLY